MTTETVSSTTNQDGLPALETVSADGVATSDIPAAVGERIKQALEICATSGQWVRLPFSAEASASTFVAQARAYCAAQSPELSFRRQAVFVADPENDDNEIESPETVQFRVTVKTAGGRSRR